LQKLTSRGKIVAAARRASPQHPQRGLSGNAGPVILVGTMLALAIPGLLMILGTGNGR